MNRPAIRLRGSLAAVLITWRRARVRAALRCADGNRGSASEQRLVDAYDRLVEAEPHREWSA